MSVTRTIRHDANAKVQAAIDAAIREGREIGLQVAAYLGEELVIDAWGGLADPSTGRRVDGDTLFNMYSVTKAVAATALHVQADRGLIDYEAPIATVLARVRRERQEPRRPCAMRSRTAPAFRRCPRASRRSSCAIGTG